MSALRLAGALAGAAYASTSASGSRLMASAFASTSRIIPSAAQCTAACTSSSPALSTVARMRLASTPAAAGPLGCRAFSSSSAVSAASPGKSTISATQQASKYLDDVLDREFANRRTYGQPLPGTPSSGRTVQVYQGDVNRAYRTMMSILRRDDIRSELRRGERYEKPNQERRRKRSERHRRRFADLVRKKVQLVMALRARGVSA